MFAVKNFHEIHSNSISWKKISRNPVLLKPRPITRVYYYNFVEWKNERALLCLLDSRVPCVQESFLIVLVTPISEALLAILAFSSSVNKS